jgi:hypothetical protein
VLRIPDKHADAPREQNERPEEDDTHHGSTDARAAARDGVSECFVSAVPDALFTVPSSPFSTLARAAAEESVMQRKKEQKTATELAELVAGRMNIGSGQLKVHSDPACGWRATVMTEPSELIEGQRRADEIAAELRENYELKS